MQKQKGMNGMMGYCISVTLIQVCGGATPTYVQQEECQSENSNREYPGQEDVNN